MEMQKRKRRLQIPPIGQRLVRSIVAVALCFAVYYIRGERGIPFYSALAVLQCIQPSMSSSRQMAIQRTLGTLIGGAWGLVVIVIQLYAFGADLQGTMFSYILVSVMTGAVIYTTVCLDFKDISYFTCVVFLSIVLMHLTDENPFLFVADRVLDTMIGVVIAIAVNAVHLPRIKNNDILFVSGLDDALLNRHKKLSPFSRIELNRMIEKGARFTVATLRAPASLKEVLAGVNINQPVIVMDGAAVYDMNENTYILTYQMSYQQATQIITFMEQQELNYFANSVTDDILVIYYQELKNQAEQEIHEKMKKSPYRNYVHRKLPENEHIVYFMVIDQTEKITTAYQKLKAEQWSDAYKIITYESEEYPGYSYIKIYHKESTRENMLKNLKAMLSMEKSIVFGSIPGKCDVLIQDSDRNVMVKKMKKLYEPIGIRKCK
ncbi:MAG: HAD hydrolase family protein [Lachnospiraceae bacterium]